jgi:hypothetical protein
LILAGLQKAAQLLTDIWLFFAREALQISGAFHFSR